MSAQTGVETPRGPASRRLGDRVKFRFERWRSEPNPLWMREMRQAARLIRTPIILMVLTVLITLMMGSLGGLLIGGTKSPAEAGSVMFHTFFSLAYFVVTLVGPALAANSIASEREGKTWEAVLLTGMRPEQIARGKFLSAYTAIAMYVVMLAPVGALPFLFGGVTPFEVLVAFVLLFFIALLGVAFGLAISAKMDSLRGALLVTLLAAVPISGFCFSTFGVGGSVLANRLWHTVPDGPPVWLPTAYGRVPFGVEYVVYLLLLPLAGLGLPAWLLYEVTRANLTSVTDDRSIGLKRWYLVACLAASAAAFIPLFANTSGRASERHIIGMVGYCLFILFCAFLFAGEEIGPSRRVRRLIAGQNALRRFLAPGVMPTARLLLIGSLAPLGALLVGGLAYVNTSPGAASYGLDEQVEQLMLFGLYAVGFTLFLVGLTAFLRARAKTAATPRVLMLVILFLVAAGPWVLAAMAGVMSSGNDSSLAVAAPSPLFVLFVVLDAVRRGGDAKTVAVLASLVASGAYAVIGAGMVVSAGRRCRAIIDGHESMLAEADRRLAAEDAEAVRHKQQTEWIAEADKPAEDDPAPEAQRAPIAAADGDKLPPPPAGEGGGGESADGDSDKLPPPPAGEGGGGESADGDSDKLPPPPAGEGGGGGPTE